MYDDVKSVFREYFIQYFFAENFEEFIIQDNDIYWIGWGSTLAINDHYVDFETIKDIIEHSIPLNTYFDWYDYALDNEYINLMSYVNIRQSGTHEDFVKFQEEQDRMRNSPEFKEKLERQLKQMKDDFIKNIS